MGTTDTKPRFSDAQRMELRSYVQLAGEVIAQYWPMRTFIHHNPLHGLETLPFEQAVKRGQELFGGRGYLPNHQFRQYLKAGRIRERDLSEALRRLVVDKQVMFGGRRLSHQEVLQASMVHGLTDAPAHEMPHATPPTASAAEHVPRLVEWLQSVQAIPTAVPSADNMPTAAQEPGGRTVSAWCDALLGTSIVETVNQELVKWCGGFLDEGEAAWRMPARERTFYRSWKALARHDYTLRLLGIEEASKKIDLLPERPDEALLDHLAHLRIPKSEWEPYLSKHLSAMPGWTGYIKWRADQSGYPWQEQYPIDLVKYLAVRLFYARELVDRACREWLGIGGNREEIHAYVVAHPYGTWLRRAWVEGQVTQAVAREVAQLAHARDDEGLEALGRRVYPESLERERRRELRAQVGQLVALAEVLEIPCDTIQATVPSDVQTILNWLTGFPPSHHGAIWLEAYEAGFRREVVATLAEGARQMREGHPTDATRPFAQVVFCIDVRSEVLRRHLEHQGGYETLGLAGFFGVPLDYQSFGAHHLVTQCPVLLKPKNQVREIPRSYHGAIADRHKFGLELGRAAETLLHDLKENVVTPYVMVEAIGWVFAVPFFGKTLIPRWYHRIGQWVKHLLMPAPATAVTVEKITFQEAEEMVAAEQQVVIREVLRERYRVPGTSLTPSVLEAIRRRASGTDETASGHQAPPLPLPPGSVDEADLLRVLREECGISPRGTSGRLERITHTGFSLNEQAYFVEAALRLMGLTTNFARVVLFCAHGSTSQNNPYESALDCGACGGNQGLPNARVIATMANRAAVREVLQSRGIHIPTDTHFCAAQHDTTTDMVRLVDLEDVPATHRRDLQRLLDDMSAAGMQAALERGQWLDGADSQVPDARAAQGRARGRRDDWSQVRPEWGLSKNGLLVIGRRELTRTVNLHGRSFLHSYDYQQDPTGKLLESIMTAPLVVAQWINMEHYFSAVDNEVYGSGSKVYHNVVARVGVMTGVSSDLRLGLPAQTVLDGDRPYHEPMRLLAVIEAPPDRIRGIIARHQLLEELFDLGWVTLLALDPETETFHRYSGHLEWAPIDMEGERS